MITEIRESLESDLVQALVVLCLRVLDAEGCCCRSLARRKVSAKRAALPRLAVNIDEASVLPHNAINRCEAKPRSLSQLSRREQWIEDVAESRGPIPVPESATESTA